MMFFLFNDTATTEIYTLSLHDALPIFRHGELYSADSIHFADSLKYKTLRENRTVYGGGGIMPDYFVPLDTTVTTRFHRMLIDRKSTRLNSSHANISYAVFCLKKQILNY